MTRSLVTGGAGFIGSHLTDALLAVGDEVLVVDDLSTGSERNLAGHGPERLRLAVGDIADRPFLQAEVEAFEPERAFHLAAQADVRKALDDPVFDATVNVIGTINVLESLRLACGTACPLVFASSGGAIYGEGDGRGLPFTESAELAPESAYGASKLAGEVYLGLYRRLYGQPALALRFANVYGPRQDPHGEAGVVAIFCGRLLGGEAPTVFGDGLQTRDYVYVGDVVASVLAAAERLAGSGTAPEGPFNVGTGVETSVLDLVAALAGPAGAAVAPVHAPARAGEVQRIAIDASAAARELGWGAEVDVTAGLARTLESVADASQA
jgi:UDP-glucose 4-epimerase